MKATILAAMMAAAGPGTGAGYTIEISGVPGTTFDGACAVRTGRGTEELSLHGTVPYKQHVAGTGFRCSITLTSDGRMTVEITSTTGSRMRSSASVSGARIRMAVQ